MNTKLTEEREDSKYKQSEIHPKMNSPKINPQKLSQIVLRQQEAVTR